MLLQENVMSVLNLQLARFFRETQRFLLKTTEISASLEYESCLVSPWASTVQYEEEYSNCLQLIQDLKLDEISFLLLSIMALTKPSGLTFVDLKAVTSVHGTFVTLLKREHS